MQAMPDNADDQVVGGAVVLPDGSQVPLSADEAKAVLDAAEAAKEAQQQKLRDFVRNLATRRDEVVRAKRPIEQRWIDDIRQYEGNSRLADTKGDKSGSDTAAEAPRIHITRARTDLWEARLSDMILPVQDAAWDLTPDKDDLPAADQNGQPITDPAIAMAVAEQACGRMRETIKSQLDDCKFQRSARRMVRDACRIGTGLLMGPMNGIKRKRAFSQTDQGSAVQIVETTVPEIREADPWCFFPDLTPSAETAEFAFYLHLMSRREVIELADYPGFDEAQIRALLKCDPELGEVGRNIQDRNKNLDSVEPTSGRYAIWRYTGVLGKDDLEALQLCGCGDEVDELDQAMVDIWFCQDYILKSKLSPMSDDFRIPYYIFAPFPADDTPFGYSLPYLCRESARFADASYRIALHNLSVSSGPIVFARKGVLKPADGRFDIRGPKWIWIDDQKGGDRDLSQLFRVDIVPNVAEQAFAALDRALQIVDLELNAEGWASQDTAQEVPTASGLAMLMNTKSIIQRRAAACADDDVFHPVIERMYWWNMQFNDDPSIRGSFHVTTSTQSVLLVKDIQVQHTLMFLQNVYGNPKFANYVNDYEALTAVAKLFDIPNRDRVLRTKEEGDQLAQQQSQNPQLELIAAKAQSEQAKAQVMQMETQIKQAKESREQAEYQNESDFRQADRQLRHEEEMAQLQARLFEARVRQHVAELHEETARIEAMQRTNMTAAQLQARLQGQQASDATKLRVKGVDAGMQAQEMMLKRQTGSGI